MKTEGEADAQYHAAHAYIHQVQAEIGQVLDVLLGGEPTGSNCQPRPPESSDPLKNLAASWNREEPAKPNFPGRKHQEDVTKIRAWNQRKDEVTSRAERGGNGRRTYNADLYWTGRKISIEDNKDKEEDELDLSTEVLRGRHRRVSAGESGEDREESNGRKPDGCTDSGSSKNPGDDAGSEWNREPADAPAQRAVERDITLNVVDDAAELRTSAENCRGKYEKDGKLWDHSDTPGNVCSCGRPKEKWVNCDEDFKSEVLKVKTRRKTPSEGKEAANRGQQNQTKWDITLIASDPGPRRFSSGEMKDWPSKTDNKEGRRRRFSLEDPKAKPQRRGSEGYNRDGQARKNLHAGEAVARQLKRGRSSELQDGLHCDNSLARKRNSKTSRQKLAAKTKEGSPKPLASSENVQNLPKNSRLSGVAESLCCLSRTQKANEDAPKTHRPPRVNHSPSAQLSSRQQTLQPQRSAKTLSCFRDTTDSSPVSQEASESSGYFDDSYIFLGSADLAQRPRSLQTESHAGHSSQLLRHPCLAPSSSFPSFKPSLNWTKLYWTKPSWRCWRNIVCVLIDQIVRIKYLTYW